MSGFCHIPAVSQRHSRLSVVSHFFRFLAVVLWLGWTIPLSANVFEATTPTSDFTDNGDGTVTHKTTGLVWKRCSEGQVWSGGTCSGTAATYTWAQATALTLTFAGKSDWRLPNIAELVSIVERQNGTPGIPAINFTNFPGTPASASWSATVDAGASSDAYIVSFAGGGVGGVTKTYANVYVRLVRGGQPLDASGLYTPTSDFTDHGNGTVTHNKTSLMWMRCTEGQNWSGTTCTGTAMTYNWAAAMLTQSYAGYTDWRLPTQNELQTVVEWNKYNPSINTTIFPTGATEFWSASTYEGISSIAWLVDFRRGYDNALDKRGFNLQVRLVRGVQSAPAVNLTALSLSCPSTLNTAATGACAATATYSNATTKSAAATWASSNPTVLTVNSTTGSLTAGSPTSDTSVTITATYTESGVTQTATTSVTVRAAALTGITLSNTSIYPAATATLSPTPSTAALGACSSGNTSVATVSGNTVTGVAAGSVTITCSGISTTLTVLPTALSGISLGSASIAVGDTTAITARPSGAALPTCDSGNLSVATVRGSTVTGVAPGSATITCGGYSQSLTVTAPTLTSIALRPSTVAVGGIATLMPAPTGAGLGACSSANTSVATVNGGTVTGVAVGSTTIQCGGVSATLTVQAPSLTGIALVSSTINAGAVTTLVPTPSSAALGGCTSSNPAVAAVSGGGVTGVASGSAIITCSGVSTGITVLPLSIAPSGISLVNSTLKVGGMTGIVPTPSSADLGSCHTGNPALASVSGGMVTALAVGNVAIVCGSVTATLTIQPPDLTAITLSQSSVAVGAVVGINPVPSSALLGACSSGNASVATVSGQAVTGVAPGTAAITCGGISTTVTVTQPTAALSDLIINCPAGLTGGTQGQCSATAVYFNGSTKAVTASWSSAKPDVLGIDMNGNLSAKAVTLASTVSVSATYSEGTLTQTKRTEIKIEPSPLGACAGERPYTLLLSLNGEQTPAPMVIKAGGTVTVDLCMANFDGATLLDVYVGVAMPTGEGGPLQWYTATKGQLGAINWSAWDMVGNPATFLAKQAIKNRDSQQLVRSFDLPATWPKGTTNLYVQAIPAGRPLLDIPNWSKLWSLGNVSFTY